MYLNLSKISRVAGGEVINPYYQVAVPANGTGYLKFDLSERTFGALNRLLGIDTSFALLLWNVLWWGLLCLVAIWLFVRYLPVASDITVVLGLSLLMLFNFGETKNIFQTWIHFRSLAEFNNLSLPYMRAFVPVIPSVCVLLYLGLQMEVFRRSRAVVWIAMAAVQFVALAIFPYATLLMAGISGISPGLPTPVQQARDLARSSFVRSRLRTSGWGLPVAEFAWFLR